MTTTAVVPAARDVYEGGVLTGTGLWADDSDTTSATTTPTIGSVRTIWGWLDTPLIGYNPDLCTASRARIRYTATDTATGTDPMVLQLSMEISDTPTSYDLGLTDSSQAVTVPLASTPQEILIPFTDFLGAPYDHRAIAHAVSGTGTRLPGYHRALRFSLTAPTVGKTLVIYEAAVELDFAPHPVARLWPRDDGLGISSAPRIWPPTKANRIVGGYQ